MSLRRATGGLRGVRTGLLLALGSTLVALLGAEAALRASDYGQMRGIEPNSDDPILVYTQEPGDRQTPAGHREHFNGYGFREREISPFKTRTRVVAVGDSFTYGLEVGPEDAWPAHLERRLNAGHEADRQPPHEVFNFGMLGYNTCQEDRVVERFVLDLDPDLLLLGWYANDPERVTWNPPICGHCLTDCSLADRAAEALTHRTRLGLAAAKGVRGLRDGAVGGAEGPSGPWGYLYRPQGIYWRGMAASLTRIVERARAASVPMAVVVFPEAFARSPNWRTDAIGALCDDLGVPWIDLRPALPGDELQWRVPKDRSHLNAAGAAASAAAIEGFLAREGLLPGADGGAL